MTGRISWTPEAIRLWGEWLATDDGRRYEAGWGTHEQRDRADRGRAWVAARLAPPRGEGA